ncbi:Long-chain fatty acid transport protein 4 [Orchesella cincta]|uniref:Long-chain-fatty-acid--CoA ligase n=1 Tax=Orchesella cincta TaxID=48709 RepID=A0A1D2MKZ9_ORCCI|nr:Long-chain fatty acid transport protein 4 [Orchesella cincta]
MAVVYLAILGVAVWTTVNYKQICAVICTLPRDIKGLVRLFKVFRLLKYYKLRNATVANIFDEMASRNPTKVLFYYEAQRWTNEPGSTSCTNRVSNYFQQEGFQKGDSVALFMENRPEFMCIWLGLSKIGVITALINTNLRLQSLDQSMKSVNCKAIIYNEELSYVLEELILNGSLAETQLYSLCSTSEAPSIALSVHLGKGLEEALDSPPENVSKSLKIAAEIIGLRARLPKAAVITNSRQFFILKIEDDDIIYTSLPLYHGAANMLGAGLSICCGVGLVIRKKFSASNFWADCVRYDVTVAQYIAQRLCRYLLAQPASAYDKTHKVRIMYGNGLRKEIWMDFVRRFGIPKINELYASTEGNCTMVNTEGKVGAVGFVPPYLNWLIPYQLVKVNELNGEPIRGKDGKYADQNASKSKVLENVFNKGDSYFRSGDILKKDIYDRFGDTFRWKSENVSTAEVESVLSAVCGLNDVIVFGVPVPGAEGRAGMAVIANQDGSLNLNALAKWVCKALPNYARPFFLRIVEDNVEKTGTCKLQKIVYQHQGYDIANIQDSKLYFLQGTTYVPLTQCLYNDIVQGKVRF